MGDSNQSRSSLPDWGLPFRLDIVQHRLHHVQLREHAMGEDADGPFLFQLEGLHDLTRGIPLAGFLSYLIIELLEEPELLFQFFASVFDRGDVAAEQGLEIQGQYLFDGSDLLCDTFAKEKVADVVVDIEVCRKQPLLVGLIEHYLIGCVARSRDELKLVAVGTDCAFYGLQPGIWRPVSPDHVLSEADPGRSFHHFGTSWGTVDRAVQRLCQQRHVTRVVFVMMGHKDLVDMTGIYVGQNLLLHAWWSRIDQQAIDGKQVHDQSGPTQGVLTYREHADSFEDAFFYQFYSHVSAFPS